MMNLIKESRWKERKRLNELIPYNDCFYRNMYRCDFLCKVNKYRCISLSMLQSCWIFGHRYDWIALLDVDELIVPRKHNSWVDMMKQVGLVAVVNFPFSSLFYSFSFSSLVLLDLFCGDFGGVPIVMTKRSVQEHF